ncbi:phospho-N-acetylmuramoyl-pentapeptide-transferase [Candidatus Falkowbacteria bacterium CG10_big_fil_rev_8_21_14_0_10_37_14]|uniref:Phospho-N-acetylmuramoyl-pentapeptide-transferase n=1 Tax=Candidatus Falkowbacteria bacterium CG10_big_fil_rev_8_21_14_0_10_37_14 TaxID=1974561 RepID=A0A2M6WSC0_9BACT|nr:phospho-N-acetylmuramoyl-pentapeptide-transferase [Candidatus Falkowbacteria bacterium]PIT95700.1 MAG: phospho-N-acetylmuramoyl-pentapeptide-transferase [Candidatus Falkowbacteria bacterium CG10_big_fil_rev_8_21_14_0_10_37_14]
MEFEIIRLLVLSTLAFIFTIAWTPVWTKILYKYRLGKQIRNSGETPIFSALHAAKKGTPTMGGVLIWVTVLLFAIFFYVLSMWWPALKSFNFLSRAETWLPLGALVASALVGLFDDWLDVRGKGLKGGGGLNIKHRLMIYTAIAAIGAWWFYIKLDRQDFGIPFLGNFNLGWWYIPVFIFVIVATSFSVNETDGLDGLAGGVLLTSFSSYSVIAFMIGQYNLAAFCAVVVGALLAFLWFNINPARFYMGDTGAMSLGVTLGVIAMLTDTALILPIIGLVFVIESCSVLIQLTSKKLRHGKKIFLSAPIHHHFEAIGWPEPKVVMRFWVVAGISSAVGLAIFLLDKIIK